MEFFAFYFLIIYNDTNMIIGITGKAGAGKGVIVDYLVHKKGYKHYSARDFIVQELKKIGLDSTRENMINIGNDLRAKYSPSYIVESLYQIALKNGGDAVIESLRTVGEVEALKNAKDFLLFAIDAPVDIRYSRIHGRGLETDSVSIEKFKEEDNLESFSTDPIKQNIFACMKMADYVFNNAHSIEDIHKEVDRVLEEKMI